MRKLIEASFLSLDGVVEGAQRWAIPYFRNDENKRASLVRLLECDALLTGRSTYDILAAGALQIEGDVYYDWLKSLPRLVASSAPLGNDPGATTIAGTAEEIAELKRRDGKTIVKFGHDELSKVVVEDGLVDEFLFSLIPVVVGSGRRIFEGIDMRHLRLELSGTTRLGNGVVTLSYAPVDVRVPLAVSSAGI